MKKKQCEYCWRLFPEDEIMDGLCDACRWLAEDEDEDEDDDCDDDDGK